MPLIVRVVKKINCYGSSDLLKTQVQNLRLIWGIPKGRVKTRLQEGSRGLVYRTVKRGAVNYVRLIRTVRCQPLSPFAISHALALR